jgi:hypothetical protein
MTFFLGALITAAVIAIVVLVVTMLVRRVVRFSHNPPGTASVPDKLHSPPRPPTLLRRLPTVPAAMGLGPASPGPMPSFLAQRCRSWVWLLATNRLPSL